jgi:cell division protein FtsW
LDSKGDKIRDMTYGLLPFSILLAVVAGLIVAEPDLGTAILVMATAGAMFFFAGAEMSQIMLALAVGTPVVGFLITQNERWMERMQGFVNPSANAGGGVTHVRGIMNALKAGGITGRGLGEGSQKLLQPYVHHTDTIFSVVGEELGLMGCVLLIGLFVFVAYRGLAVSFRAKDRFGTLLAVGVTGSIAFQAVVHIAGNSGALPFTGIPLPFVSYGGSSLVMCLAGVGVMLSISRTAKRRKHSARAAFGFGRGDRRPRLSHTRRR